MSMHQHVHIGPIVKATLIDPTFDMWDGFYEDLEPYLVTPAEGYNPELHGWVFTSNMTDHDANISFSPYTDYYCECLTPEDITSKIEAFKETHSAGLALLQKHFTDIIVTYGVIVDWI